MAGFIGILLLTAVAQINFSIEDVERRLGPFTVSGESFTVVLHNKRIVAGSDEHFSETLFTLEIRDRNGATAYERTFPYQLNGGRFTQVVSASARLLPGESLAGLLIEYREDPFPAGSEQYWQILRFKNGKLGLFDVSSTPNQAAQNPFLGAVAIARNSSQPGPGNHGEMSELKIWTGNFYAIVPLRVDWLQGRVSSGQQCFELIGGSMAEVGCEMRVEVHRKPIDADLGSVRLFHEATENMGMPRHLVFNKDSRIEVLGAKAIMKMQVTNDLLEIRLSDVWLKVLIDDSEDNLGWIHTNEDFSGIGLPSGSPAP
jgi:hypothetical protein